MVKSLYKRMVPEKKRNTIRLRINKVIAPIYYGNKYFCNCCNKSFRKFLSKGNIRRDNAKCPYCGSLERTRVLLFYLQRETDIFNRRLKVLHFAPVSSLFEIFKKLNIEYVDGDINPANATHVIDITNIPYPDNTFDLIICSHVLGHVPDEAKAIQELRRVLKTGGSALVLTLINRKLNQTLEDDAIQTKEERLHNYGEPDLCRLHGVDFISRLEKQSFNVTCIDYARQLPQDVFERYRLGDGDRELIYKCLKE